MERLKAWFSQHKGLGISIIVFVVGIGVILYLKSKSSGQPAQQVFQAPSGGSAGGGGTSTTAGTGFDPTDLYNQIAQIKDFVSGTSTAQSLNNEHMIFAIEDLNSVVKNPSTASEVGQTVSLPDPKTLATIGTAPTTPSANGSNNTTV